MVRLAANISTMFPELPLLERIDAAAEAGFPAVEIQFPYAVPPQRFSEKLQQAGMRWVLFNAPPGRSEQGERGIASLPGREADFDASIDTALQYIEAGDCRRVHVMAGLLPEGADRRRHLEQFVASISRAADRLAEVDADVMIEPINTRVDVPGYLLDGTRVALECIAAADRGNIRLQYDVYHMQIMEGNLIDTIKANVDKIAHIQIADVPGRHEPGTGEINFEFLLAHLDRIGYSGWVGCEYNPRGDTLAGLTWAKPYL